MSLEIKPESPVRMPLERQPYLIPTWDDMCVLKDIFFDDEEEVYQIHPKKSEYVNLSENCLHLWEPIGHELGELVEKRYE